ncbi:MAG TPA: GntR family transcriptional regulator [Actinospica sp.]|nr:GntR family transcriptional regulator [Actinospica sp.]
MAASAARERDGAPYPAFQAVRTGNAFEETVERILRSVKLGVVRPGERLPPERELAAQLRVSRDTLREAIHALAAEGILASTRGRSGGTRVLRRPVPPPPERLRDLVAGLPGGLEDALVFRRAVEIGAAEAAAARALDAGGRRLLTTRMEAAEQAGSADYRIADTRYHLALAELSGSAQLTAAVGEARLRVNDLLDAIPMLEANLRHSADQHRRISAAVLGGDPEAARAAMAEHLDATAVLLRGFLEA